MYSFYLNKKISFVNNGVTCTMNPRASFDTNRTIVVDAFGSSNCTGDLAMSNSKKTLMNILGIIDVNAVNLGSNYCVTCHNSDYIISVNSWGDNNYVIISNDTYECHHDPFACYDKNHLPK